ncbi:MAG TPA: 3-deoxy-manno-octulosonate cytidylyltransferase, partial [Elusimicrobia bacterium]|nr:3-deoxy-manno-octulosonate cytidylyltransferase [Elusimicrobiota bacterium]
VQWVWEEAKKVKFLNDLIIATDDRQILERAEKFGADVMMTSKKWRSGTERCAEVARKISADLIVYLQGDEPLVLAKTIDKVIEIARKEKNVFLTTAAVKIRNRDEFRDENMVKVVCSYDGYALYFSRAPIPYPQGGLIEYYSFYKHMGIFVYPKERLLKFVTLPVGTLEKIENLEQLRILEHGFKIRIVLVKEDTHSVETPADLSLVEKILEER